MLFSPHLITLKSDNKPVSLHAPKLWGQKLYVVPRAQCAFRRLTLKGPSRVALKAAYLKARNNGLDAHDKFLIVPDINGENAGQWGFVDALNFIGGAIPESLVYSPIKDGLRLVKCLEGVEGQCWHRGDLIASRWWGQEPTQSQWQSFVRSIPVSVSQLVRDLPETVPDLHIPKFRPDLPLLSLDIEKLKTVLSPTRVAAIGGSVFALLLMFYGGQYLRSTLELNAAEKENVRVSDEARLILSQRRRAIGHQAYIEKYRQLGDESMLLRAIEGVAGVLGSKEFRLDSFRISDKKIEMRAYAEPDFDQALLVKELEALPTLDNVSLAVGGRDLITITSNLVPHAFHNSLETSK